MRLTRESRWNWFPQQSALKLIGLQVGSNQQWQRTNFKQVGSRLRHLLLNFERKFIALCLKDR